MQAKMKVFYFLLSLTMVIGVASCRDKDDNEELPVAGPGKVTVSFTPKWNGDNFVMQDVYYDDFGNRIRVDNFLNYFSMLTLVKEDGTEVLLKDFYLADFFNENTFTFDVAPGKYTGLKVGIGIPAAYNKHIDPAQYASSNPLSVAGSQGMFWTWSTGYIFTKFEGKADTTGTEGAELLHPFSFHIGDDPFFRQFASTDENIVVSSQQTSNVHININIDHILAPGGSADIDLASDAITHTSTNTELATKFADNFLSAITVE